MSEKKQQLDEQNWAMFCHLSALLGFLLPFGNIIGPLVLWLVKRDESALVDEQGKEALNFNISVAIYGIVCVILMFVLIGFVLLPLLYIFWFIMVVVAAIKTSADGCFHYPLALPLLR